jgi:hypothetical protein
MGCGAATFAMMMLNDGKIDETQVVPLEVMDTIRDDLKNQIQPV